KRARGFAGWLNEAFDLDDRYARFYLTESDLDEVDVEAMIDDIIRSHIH
ncbi:sporulation protein SpoOM, partial [Fischerella thermalis CCMEE 5328]